MASIRASNMYEVNQNLRVCYGMLSSWNHSEFGHVQSSICAKKLELTHFLDTYAGIDNSDIVTACKDFIAELEKNEKVFWK